MIDIVHWGRIPYSEAWQKQTALFQARIEAKQQGENLLPDLLISCEHNPVYTLGKNGMINNLLLGNNELEQKGVEFFKTDRGGDITYHGPGQIVIYPILDLEHFGLGLKAYINCLEEAVISFLKNRDIQAGRLDGATGVWLQNPARKICAIGVRCSRYITMHGLALNINTDLNYFRFINPCGFVDKGVTSLQAELGGAVQDLNLCRDELMQELKKQFS
ncbi:MAG: lipoyl(octanoyl) transferase LipB [Bacteroidales bacterium]|jgi:lipoyl(octanoyl) transferase|nr:lipoyl(octanoyl) transferase LipB [Bacteroidales bacterium]MDI9545611.1 lipoyl(octanoyl) transferase LipB [Bacteroidota bacterium]OQC03651.1 MAG: Octanoyltransferase [Bacteroidetes bacterium ADurb.Bin090]MBP8981439.1 lipoyl(octanoyl) transferase LipB [Bacteroidales bacterium]NLV38966.1 lipoyl(octanoyl) transferase LipB [Bacteroidales bacterium]